MAVALLAGPSPASAQYVNSTPSISGTAQVGKTLTASGGNNAGGPHGTIVAYVWMRCDNNTTYARGCTLLKDRNETNYVLAQADRNAYMRVARVALKWWQPWVGWSLNDVAHRVSGPTKRVAAAPVATPTPTPTPVTTPTPTPTPVATPVKTPTATATVTPEPTVVPPPSFDTGAEPAPAVEPAAQPDPPAAQPPATDVRGAADTKPAKMLKPFPVVRISGRLTTGGANIQVLSVKAPKGAKVTVNCLGKGCPRKAVARGAKANKVVRITPFQRVLPAGIKLRISISKPGYISKVTTIAIRKGKAPLRSDQCRMPGAKKLIRCPK